MHFMESPGVFGISLSRRSAGKHGKCYPLRSAHRASPLHRASEKSQHTTKRARNCVCTRWLEMGESFLWVAWAAVGGGLTRERVNKGRAKRTQQTASEPWTDSRGDELLLLSVERWSCDLQCETRKESTTPRLHASMQNASTLPPLT